MPDIKPDLIVRLPNWVGDVIMCLPALETLSQHGLKLALLGKPWIHDLLKDMPYELHTFKDIHSFQMLACDKVLLLTNSFSSALKARLARKKSLGYSSDGRSLLLTKAIKKPSSMHETVIFNTLAIKALDYFFNLKQHTEVSMNPKLHIKAKALYQMPYVVLCPFAHGLSANKKSKKWPHWHDFSKAIEATKPIICPSPAELEEARLNYPHLKIMDNLSLYEYATILSKASLVIANDSGPMHIATALNTPTIGIFGVSDPQRTGPKQALILGNNNNWPHLDEVFAAAKPYFTSTNLNL